MCVVSMVFDHYWEMWNERRRQVPWVQPAVYPPMYPVIPQSEIDEFRKLLDRAREYDRKNNEPD